MEFFDLHHHHSQKICGIYNLNFGEPLPDSYFSVGIHPALAEGISEEYWKWVEEMAQRENCLGIGECGLDGLVKVPEIIQRIVFERQIHLANKLRKPLIIHCVRRFSQLIAIRKKIEVPVIVHGFNKKKTVGIELLKHDFYLSFGKSVLHDVNLQQFVKDFPLEKMFLETDSATFDIELLYSKIAEIKNISLEEFNNQIHQNLKIFNISEIL
ncbi:TatD family hydrolase [Kaistella polysaccharea]|uniref:TatD family hydrolase n=1 Tax=Kaistella polysaccharea TaxID=2878534 RepID=UPI001CF36508|nr:TatD family hydrolase [Kaistella polysaccharea]